jgi:Flp pilus assembly protein TadG
MYLMIDSIELIRAWMDKLMKPPKKMARKISRRERGQSLTELALSFMIIAFLLSGAIDFGRGYFTLIALRDAAQEGAIYASLAPADEDGILDRIKDSSSGPLRLATDPKLTFTVDTWGKNPPDEPNAGEVYCSGFYLDGGARKANTVTVTVVYQFPITMALIQVMVPGNMIELTAASAYTILYPPCI